ncbi:unnamed protein product [Medioppia subpectinata]|uniref:Uncharacterized protein n=1 Tax=Medioppia subpectinata TaxID=1979941 RepID=A0A7R9Q0F4_9ACAR|nr:unnamed protein product [Medioppia subpectinata]CAG2107236.1 unnamed protein product [Medioppia subpectinata]
MDLFDVFESNTSQSVPKKRKLDETEDKECEDLINEVIGHQNEDKETKKVKTGEESEIIEIDVQNDDQNDDNNDDNNDDDIQEVNEVNDELVAKTVCHELEGKETCLHEVVLPVGLEYVALREPTEDHKPAKEYEFVLDPFQKEAILCIDNNQSVLVSAHTSAGKTVVAEYAIAMSLRDKQRVIYTTPIKALSNQKYREFHEEFEDVGLITGDVTINPMASCLIMTTEILRLMLFRGSEVMREVGWVIFDEIHYMRDRERGVVWEETIILLPDTVHYVFLSATIPNARQFAEWIAHLHQQSCHVVYTDYRPVPLQHYIYPSGGDGLHLVVDEGGNFREDNFNLAMNVLQNAGDAAKGDFAMRGRKGGMKDDEKDLVEEVFNNAIDVLSDEDKKLPQVEHILPLLRRGIGIHHSGLLPIIKETIEILFSEGLIKALFATETFAMGLNMPARTVVFTNARKFDGTDFRWLTSGEYIQMSGRAGRRGLDERGIVILMIDEKMSPSVGKELIKGKPDFLNSAFHLTYNMVLNLLRVEEVNPEYMLQHSFYQFQHYSEYPKLQQRLEELQKEYDSTGVSDEHYVSDYIKVKTQLNSLSQAFLRYITSPQYIIPFLVSGRLLKVVSNDGLDMDWGAVVNFNRKVVKSRSRNPSLEDSTVYTIDILLNLAKNVDPKGEDIFPPKAGEKGEMRVVTISLTNISQISSLRIFIPQELRNVDNRQSVLKSIGEVKNRFTSEDKKINIPLLDPIEDMKIKDKEFKAIVKKTESCEKRFAEFKSIDSNSIKLFEKKSKITEEMKKVRQDVKKAQSLLQMKELKCRKRVLRRLGYCTAADVIEIKGRVACEITSGDELLLTEMLFNGVFNDLNVYQISALLSCFVFEEKTQQVPKLTDELSKPLRTMQELAKRIATVSIEAKLDLDETQYIEKFKPNLMDVIYSWAKGSSFAQLCKMTDAFEGSIIRCMRRLEELLRQMCQSAKVIGNTDLENKFSEAIKLIKRDIVFAASLYL